MMIVRSILGLFFSSILLFSAVGLSAQETSVIQGRITDNETGETMRSATVFVVGTKMGAVSDVKGQFTVKRVPPGTYTLRFSYINYKTKTVEGVIVEAGKPTTVNVVLESAIKKTEEVIVQARRTNDNASAILAQRKNAAQLSDGVSIEEIKKLPDSDAGQALKRVPGVTLVEGKYVFVRGSSDRYSNTTLNGASLSSTEPDKKSFAFDMFPSEFLQNANVAKSFTPDLPGNFAGGLVQLNTVDFPEAFSIRFSATTSFNDNVTFKGDKFFTSEGSSTDWLALDDGLRGIPSTVPETRQGMDNLRSRAGALTGSAPEDWINLGKSFRQESWRSRSLTVAPNTSYALSFANKFQVADNDFGVIANISYSNSYAFNNLTRAGINVDRSPLFEYAGGQASRSVSWGGLLNLSYKIGENSSLTLKNVYNRSSDDETISLDGSDIPQNQDRRYYSFQFIQKELLSSQLGGSHTLPFQNALLEWTLGYSASKRDEPDLRRLRYNRVRNSQDAFIAAVPITPQGAGDLAGRFYSTLNDNVRTANVNLTLPFDQTKLKVGGLFERRNRSFSARSMTIIQSRTVFTDVPDTDVDLSLPPGLLLQQDNFRGDGLGISEDSKLSDTYSAEESLNAAYLMLDQPLSIGGADLRVIAGFRVEDNLQSLASFDQSNRPVNVALKTTDVLPALNLVWKTNDAMNVRVSASQTLARPAIREFAPFAFFDYQSQARTEGNPNLNRALIQNYDIRYEWFTGPGEVISVSGFYKIFQNAIEQTIIPSPGNVVFSFQNAQGNATNYGVEFELRKQLTFLGSALENFTFSGNVALIQSNLRVLQAGREDDRAMWGQSPYSVNASLYYQHPQIGTAITLGYNVAGRRIIQVADIGVFGSDPDPHVYELPRDVIDFSVVQPIAQSWEIKLMARDLLNQPLVWEQLGRNIQTNLRGRTFTFGISYRLQ
jgi:outer membrane receptor protein involved in Fe transport